MDPMIIQQLKSYIVPLLTAYVPKIILGFITLWLGFKLSNFARNSLVKILKKKDFDQTLIPFLGSLLASLIKVMVLISVASILGIETTSFVAVLGAMGLAVGMALQGSLANFAGGVLILVFKPFKVGDVINASGETGCVQEISLFVTVIKSPDNQIIYLPNGSLASGVIRNINQEGTRRVDMTFGIGYSDDIDQAKSTLSDILSKNTNILSDPAPAIFVSALADSSVNFAVRPWCKSEHYWDVMANVTEEVKKRFDAEKISIPFPQRDVHLYKQ